jgi:hypothetical protein
VKQKLILKVRQVEEGYVVVQWKGEIPFEYAVLTIQHAALLIERLDNQLRYENNNGGVTGAVLNPPPST